MASLVITQNITVDGVVEVVGDWFSTQTDDVDSADQLALVQEQMRAESGFLVGRQTFTDMRGFWPHQTDDTTGITAHLDTVAKYVVSTTLGDPEWQNTTVIDDPDPMAAIDRLKRTTEGEIGVTGSITLCHALMAAGLVDEYRLFVFPRIIGQGRRLFPDGVDVRLRPTGQQHFANGTTLLTYDAA